MLEEPTHECSDCGFLTVRSPSPQTGVFLEVGDQFRRTAVHRPDEGLKPSPGHPLFLPVCFRNKFNLNGEIIESPGWDEDPPTSIMNATRQVVHAERYCDGWTKWQPGFTPKEHREMVDRELEKKEAAELRHAIWKREDKRDADARAWQESRHRTDLLVFGGLIALATLVGGVLGGLLSRGADLWPF